MNDNLGHALTEEIAHLYVDGDLACRKGVAAALAQADTRFSVETATSVQEGLDLLAEASPDCITARYALSDLTGIEFFTAVRETHQHLPFILYTSNGSETTASKAITAGITDYLQKETSSPTGQHEQLASRIQAVVNRSGVDGTNQDTLSAFGSAHQGIGIIDDASGLSYLNEAYAELHGYDPVGLIDCHWKIRHRDTDAQRIHTHFIILVSDEGSCHGTTTAVCADGSSFIDEQTLTGPIGGISSGLCEAV